MGDNEGVDSMKTALPGVKRTSRLRNAVFESVGEEGKAAVVERQINSAINRGVLFPGERLPAESELAKSFGVSPVTVREALGLLRERGLVVTKRGRGGGSFVTERADPIRHAQDVLMNLSRTSLRDLGAHYFALTAACLELAAHRADQHEVDAIRERLIDTEPLTSLQWRHIADDVVVELCALGQSARLTREQMRTQAEFSPLLGLLAADSHERERQHHCLNRYAEFIAVGDADATRSALREEVAASILHLEQLRRASSRSSE
ncbi:GntR family transcriptional regulator [Arthrobacter flavus]|uniref:FadR/GntR family transcriptional regulator n=1 Tax=Arthrobacter flavus TaxID=95172 RepID=A0ABW4Q743_9MICC